MSSQEVFGHIKKAHTDLALPALHHDGMSEVGWGLDSDELTTENGKASMEPTHEMLETLTVLDSEERFLLSCDNTLAYAYGDKIAVDYNSRFARSSIAVKGRGREDAKAVIGSVKQNISIPTTLQKVRRILTGRGGKEKEEEETTETEATYQA